MPASSKALKTDVNATPAPQYFDTIQDDYAYSVGASGVPGFRPASEPTNKFSFAANESSALSNLLNAKVGPGNLYGVTITNTGGNIYYVQIYDTNGGVPTGTPRFVFRLAANTTADFGTRAMAMYGKYFNQGIVIAVSTTPVAYTAGSSDCWFMADVA